MYNRSRIIGDREEEQIGERGTEVGRKIVTRDVGLLGSVKMMEAATILVEGGV